MASESRVLVLAPWGRDSPVICQVLEAGGLETVGTPSLPALLQELDDGAGLAFITEEALTAPAVHALRGWLANQPTWSDFPLVVLAARHGQAHSAPAHGTFELLGNVVLLERPLHAESLLSAARSALRGRRRQYDIRQHLEAERRAAIETARLLAAERRAQEALESQRESLLAAERRARVEAEHASRMKDEFLATLSHELRTPLAAIIGWTHVLRRARQDNPGDTRAVDTIERNARTQARLIDDLLDMSRIISGHVRLELDRLDLALVAESVLSSLEPTAHAKRLTVTLEVGDTATRSTVRGDSHRLQQVVWNLLSNAFKFTPTGGTVDVALHEAGHHVELSVTDSGPGIAADFLPFVFDRFRQSDASTTRLHGGLGLGLAIVKNLVQLHGGTVHVESAGAGRGAKFSIRLPVVEADMFDAPCAVAPGDAPPHATTHDLSGQRVLVVDDEPDLCDLLKHELQNCGATVFAVGSAAEALEVAACERPHLLISDIGMPDMDGYALMRQVRAADPDHGGNLPAIALTAFAGPEDRARALAAGFTVHIAKPVDPAELIDRVAALLQTKAPELI